jgi:hypothetical protein
MHLMSSFCNSIAGRFAIGHLCFRLPLDPLGNSPVLRLNCSRRGLSGSPHQLPVRCKSGSLRYQAPSIFLHFACRQPFDRTIHDIARRNGVKILGHFRSHSNKICSGKYPELNSKRGWASELVMSVLGTTGTVSAVCWLMRNDAYLPDSWKTPRIYCWGCVERG